MKHSHGPKHDSLSGLHEYRNAARNRLLLSMVITGSVMVAEVLGGFLTGSLALISDAGHMFTHLFALALSLAAIIIACKAPCHHRTFGFYRAEILAALFNSVFLFAMTAYIFYEAVQRLLAPQPVNGFEMFLVALLGLAANGFSIVLLRGSVGGGLNVKSAFFHMAADAASSVVIIIGAIIVSVTGWFIIDPLLAIGVSVLIFVWAWGLLKESVNVLLETAPEGMDVDTVGAELKKNMPEILEITDMHIWEITSGMYSLTAHVRVERVCFENSKELIERVNRLLDEKYGIQHTTVQLECAD